MIRPLTGAPPTKAHRPEAVTFAEIAAILTAAGRPAVFVDETLDEAYASRARWNAPRWQLDAWVSTYTAVAAGELAHVSGDVERLTGRAPLSLAQFLAADPRPPSDPHPAAVSRRSPAQRRLDDPNREEFVDPRHPARVVRRARP